MLCKRPCFIFIVVSLFLSLLIHDPCISTYFLSMVKMDHDQQQSSQQLSGDQDPHRTTPPYGYYSPTQDTSYMLVYNALMPPYQVVHPHLRLPCGYCDVLLTTVHVHLIAFHTHCKQASSLRQISSSRTTCNDRVCSSTI